MRRPLLALLLFGILLGAVPAHAASTPKIPATVSYQFTHGAVVHNRNMSLGLVIQTEDPSNNSDNSIYKVGFTAKMVQYITFAAKDGSAILEVGFNEPVTNVNDRTVTGSIPPPYDQQHDRFNRYLINIDSSGMCNCSQMPRLIYDAPNNVPRYVWLGDYFTYLHPSLPRSAAQLAKPWVTRLPIGLVPGQVGYIYTHNHLSHSATGWSVVTSLDQQLSATIPAKLWTATPLTSSAPVQVRGSITVNSTLTLGQSDGVRALPANATKKTAAHICAACSGYPQPLQGVLHLRLLYTQNGNEVYLRDMKGTLNVSLTS